MILKMKMKMKFRLIEPQERSPSSKKIVLKTNRQKRDCRKMKRRRNDTYKKYLLL